MKELIIKIQTNNETNEQVVSHLQRLENIMGNMQQHMQQQSQVILDVMLGNQQGQTTPVELPDSPLSREEDLRILEFKLKDGTFMDKMVRDLKSVEVDDAKKHTKTILSRLMTKELASKFTCDEMRKFTENHGVENTYPKACVANTSIPDIKRREMDQSNIPQEFSSSQADKDLKYLYQKIEELERERAKYERDLDTLTEQAGNLSDSDGTDEEEQEGEDEEKAGNKKKDNISDANKTQSESTVNITGGEKGLMYADDYVKIQKNFEFLCDELYPENIICPLFEKGVFTLNNVEELEANLKTGDLRGCNKNLLSTLYRCGPKAYSLFLECLKEQKYFQAIRQLEPISNVQICENDICRGRMPQEDYDKIQCNMEYLKDELQPKHFITPLFSFNILAEDDVFKLEAIKTRNSCINSLLFILLRRGPRAYGCFCKCLLNGHLHVLRKLEPESKYYEFHVKYPDKKYDFKSDSSSESNSKMIKETDKNLAKYIDDKYRDGEIVTGVSNVTKGCVKVTFRVLIRDKSEIKGEDIKAHIESGLKAGFIGPDAVIEEGFTFIHLIESDLEKEIAKMKAQNLELKKKKEKLERRLKRSKRNKDGNSRKQEDVKPIKECDIRDVSRLEGMMENIQKQNQEIIDLMSAKNPEQTTTPVELLDPPLSSEEGLGILENKLTDGVFMERMVRNLKSVEVDDAKKHTKAILSRLLTKDLASKYTWTGTNEKKPFKDFLVNKLVQTAVRRNPNHWEATDELIKEYTRQWLSSCGKSNPNGPPSKKPKTSQPPPNSARYYFNFNAFK